MKLLILSLLVLSTQIFAAEVELGKYRAVDADTKTIISTFLLRENGTVNFNITSPDFTMPAPGCEGTYKVVGNEFSSDMKCPTDLLPEASVKIDISKVNSENLRTENGVEVDVIIDAFGDEAVKFLLKKND